MSTLNQLSYNIYMSVKPHLTDDEDLTIRKVKYDIGVQRALLLRNELNKNRTIDQNIVQSLGCVELEATNPVDCCIDIPLDCKIMRSVKPIPKTIELHNKTLLTRIGSIFITDKKFNFVPYDRFIFSGNGKYNKNDIFVTLLDNHLILKSNNDDIYALKYIDVHGVFEDPQAVADFKDCDDKPCYSDDNEYPLNKWMEKYIGDILEEKYIKYTLRATKDMINDGEAKQTD